MQGRTRPFVSTYAERSCAPTWKIPAHSGRARCPPSSVESGAVVGVEGHVVVSEVAGHHGAGAAAGAEVEAELDVFAGQKPGDGLLFVLDRRAAVEELDLPDVQRDVANGEACATPA